MKLCEIESIRQKKKKHRFNGKQNEKKYHNDITDWFWFARFIAFAINIY